MLWEQIPAYCEVTKFQPRVKVTKFQPRVKVAKFQPEFKVIVKVRLTAVIGLIGKGSKTISNTSKCVRVNSKDR